MPRPYAAFGGKSSTGWTSSQWRKKLRCTNRLPTRPPSELDDTWRDRRRKVVVDNTLASYSTVPGINRFSPFTASLAKTVRATKPAKPCVFISHKREDSQLALQVGELLRDMEIDIWLDLHELHAAQPTKPSEEKVLAEAIEAGIANSTHLLALITVQTKGSWWVPYEIGSARSGGSELAFLLHKDVPSMPSYFIFGEWLVDQESLCKWAEKLSSIPQLAKINTVVQLANRTALDALLPKTRRF